MATISENLLTLNETKQAIKTAIESKGQDLTDVPFTSYADKIAEISGGSGKKIITGTVTFATTASRQKVTHNLGTIPSCVMLYPKDLSIIPTSGTEEAKGGAYKFACVYSAGLVSVGNSFQGNTNTGVISWQVSGGTSTVFKIDETTFTTGTTGVGYKYGAGIEYEWIAIE